LTLGAYFAFFFRVGMHLPLLWALLLSMVVTALLSIAVDQAIYRHLRGRGPVILLIASVGVALILRNLIVVGWGAGNQYLAQGIQFHYRVGGLVIKPNHILIVSVALVLAVGVHAFLRYTKLGKAMRAMADTAALAQISGIDTRRVIV